MVEPLVWNFLEHHHRFLPSFLTAQLYLPTLRKALLPAYADSHTDTLTDGLVCLSQRPIHDRRPRIGQVAGS